jgi:hypothetical protein
MDRRMWVFILLLLIGSTIIVTRIFRNGAREEATEPTERTPLGARQSSLDTPAQAPTQSAPPSAPSTAAPSSVPRPAAPYPPAVAEHPGGPCPSCGTETVPGAKFCGECGHRLTS